MSLIHRALPAGIVVVAATFGCARNCAHPPVCSQTSFAEYALPLVERTSIVGEVDDALLAESADDALDADPQQYRALTAAEAQCLAVEASMLGNLLDRQRAICCNDGCGLKHQGAQHVQLAVLRHVAAEARNKNGADALKLYYGLAEVEAGLDSVTSSLAEIDDVQENVGQMRGQELSVPFDASQFDRERQTLISRRAELEATRATLSAKLRTLLGFEAVPDAAAIWPAEPLRLTDVKFNVEEEISYGLTIKPELAALQRLAMADEQSTKAAADALLGDVHGLMGVAARSMFREMLNSMLGISGDGACLRKAQIRELHRRRAMQLSADIRAAVEVIDARSRQALAAQRKVESREARLAELTQRRETGQSSFVELSEVRLKLVEDRAAVTSAVIAWKRAIVDLRELQGALVAECRGGMCPAVPQSPEVEMLPTPNAKPAVQPLPPIDLDTLDVDELQLEALDV